LNHGEKVDILYARETLTARTGADWPRRIRLVGSLGEQFVKSFDERIE
jgi:hypothetical protein